LKNILIFKPNLDQSISKSNLDYKDNEAVSKANNFRSTSTNTTTIRSTST